MNEKILCSVSTKGRYDSTLPLTLASIISQTRVPDKLVLFDDNDEPKDLRNIQHYLYLLMLLDIKKIQWEVIYGAKKGQSHNHQIANTFGFDWVWRLDDDNVAEPNVLETLMSYIADDVGAIGGTIPTPNALIFEDYEPTGKIERIYDEPNLQWKLNIKEQKSVDHLHCSYLYRAGVQDFNLGLSKLCHREETLHTYGIKQKGFKILVVPNCITWHLKNNEGGIRSSKDHDKLLNHDERIFSNIVNLKDRTIVVLNNGMGDHIVFKKVLKDIENPILFTCYPDIIPGKSIAEAKFLFGDIEEFNIYRKMSEWNWTDSIENAFRKLYRL
jgi:hypothetical protein